MPTFDQKKVDLMNDCMIDGFQTAGLTVPAADPAVPPKEARSSDAREELLTKADQKRARKQAARRMLMRRTANRED